MMLQRWKIRGIPPLWFAVNHPCQCELRVEATKETVDAAVTSRWSRVTIATNCSFAIGTRRCRYTPVIDAYPIIIGGATARV